MSNRPIDPPQFFESESKLPPTAQKVDGFDSALRELFYIENPGIAKSEPDAERLNDFLDRSSAQRLWVYYPWRDLAICIPDEETYYRLRTARNRVLISDDEQTAYRRASLGIAGLSVGSAVLSALVATGGPKHLRLADHDTVEITNLNRMRATLLDLGASKSDVAARSTWELDPFAQIDLWDAVVFDRADEFCEGLTVLVDEMDHIGMKIALRESARKARVPVVMATDNGDGAIVDVERFDIEPERPLFHGRVEMSAVPDTLSREEFAALASKIIDPTLFTPRQRESVAQVAKTLSGVSQIATAATIAGAAAAYAVRLIASGQDLPSGRYILAPEATFSTTSA